MLRKIISKNRPFFKIWVVALIVIIVVGGIFTLQHFGTTKENVSEKINLPTNDSIAENGYPLVKLKDVIKYSDINKENYVKTSGTIVGLEYGAGGGSILLSDDESNYLWVYICHACVSSGNYDNILPALRQGDKIEVSGDAGDVVIDADFDNLYNVSLYGQIPERIGMIGLDYIDGIKKN